MPTFKQVTVTSPSEAEYNEEIEVDVDFEIYCAKCGAGICDHGDTRKSRRRQQPQLTIEPCSRCMDELREEIKTLESLADKLADEKGDLLVLLQDAQKELRALGV